MQSIGSPRPGRWSRWAWLTCLACAAWTASAAADDYLILSLLGNQVTTVTEGPRADGSTDDNLYEVARLTGTALDDFVLRIAGGVIQKVVPAASVTMLRATDPKLYASSDGWIDVSPDEIRSLVSFVAQAAPKASAAHLLLIAPYRARPQLRTATDFRGTGSVAGLGFYVGDHLADGSPGARFLGVFAHFQLLLINVRSSLIETRELIVVGTAYPAARAPDGIAWNALSPERKIETLQALTQGEIERVLPGMLRLAKP